MKMLSLVENQRVYFNSNASKSVVFRIEQLKRLRSILKANEPAIFEAINTDYQKSGFDSFLTEFLVLYDDLDVAIRKVSRWAKTKRAPTNLLNWPSSSYIIPEPLGVTLVIGAWNYPIQLSLTPVVAAMAAGNTIILKPSELCSATSRITAKLINENFAPEYFKVVGWHPGNHRTAGREVRQDFLHRQHHGRAYRLSGCGKESHSGDSGVGREKSGHCHAGLRPRRFGQAVGLGQIS